MSDEEAERRNINIISGTPVDSWSEDYKVGHIMYDLGQWTKSEDELS